MSSNNCYYDRDFRKRDTDTGLRGKKITNNETLDAMYTDFFGRTDKVKIFECNTSGTSDEWQKPEGWLDLPMPAANAQEFYGLFPVWEYADNSVALSVTGTSAYFVDWGDGIGQLYNSGDVAEHVYDFNDLNPSTLFVKGNYRQAIVRILMLGGDMTGLSLMQLHSQYPYGSKNKPWLNINLNGPNITTLELTDANQHYLANLRRLGLYNLNSITEIGVLLDEVVKLERLEITGTDSLTSMPGDMIDDYTYGVQELPLFNTSNVTYFSGFNYEDTSDYYPMFDFSNVETFYFGAREYGVVGTIPAWDLSNASVGYVETAQATRVQATGIRIDVNVSWYSRINRFGLLELFNNLGTAVSGATITLYCRSRNDLTPADIQIATDKGFTVIVA